MTDEQLIESLRFKNEAHKMRIANQDIEMMNLKKQVQDKDRIIEGYQKFIRDNLHNVRRTDDVQ